MARRYEHSKVELREKAIVAAESIVTQDGYHSLNARRVAAEMRQNPEPFLLECVTFRMRGHEEASGTKYVPKELMDEWAQKDPQLHWRGHLQRRQQRTREVECHARRLYGRCGAQGRQERTGEAEGYPRRLDRA